MHLDFLVKIPFVQGKITRRKKKDVVYIEVKVKSFALRQIQRRSFAALAIALSRKFFRPRHQSF